MYTVSVGSGVDHFYTTNPNEIGTTTPGTTGRYGYKSEGIAGKIYNARVGKEITSCSNCQCLSYTCSS